MEPRYTLLPSLALCAVLVHAQGPSSDIAPNFILPDIDGVEHNMYQHLDSGKVVIIDFWATWCQPCFESMPGVEAIWNMHGPDGDNTVMVFAMEMDNITWDEEAVRNGMGIEYPVFDNGHVLHPDWHLNGYPTFAIICPDRSWTMVEGNLMGNPNFLLPHINACPAPSTLLHDARPVAYLGAQNLCGAPDWQPVITIQNRGADVMTSAVIETWVAGTLQSTYTWSGSLGQYYVSDSIMLPVLSGLGNSVQGQFVITQVNGAPDSSPSDNTLPVNIGNALPGTAVQLELQTDDFAWSIAYALYDDLGNLVDTMDVPMDSHLFQNWQLDDDVCYRFLITDYLGEGMGNAGFYKLRDSQGNLFAQGSQFGYSAQHTFVIDADMGVEEAIVGSLAIHPNPSTGWVRLNSDRTPVRIDVLDAQGRLVFEPVPHGDGMLDLSHLPDGSYHLRATLPDGSRRQGPLLLVR